MLAAPLRQGAFREAPGRSCPRQVTVIEREMWETMMAELGGDLDTSARRANLMLSGIRPAHSRGKVLRLGDVVELYTPQGPPR